MNKMPFINPLLGARLAYVLGITNLIGLFLVLLTCRCSLKIKSLQQNKTYMWLYKYHCYFWWFFLASVFAHAVIAILAFGVPF